MLHEGGRIAPDISLELSLPKEKGTANGWRVKERRYDLGNVEDERLTRRSVLASKFAKPMTRARERTLCLPDAPARRSGIFNLFLPHCNTRTGCYGSLQFVLRARDTIFWSFRTQ